MSEPTRSPRVKLHKNGHVTISGLNYRDARSLFVKAILQMDTVEKEKKESMPSLPTRERAWWRNMRWVAETLERAVGAEIQKTHPAEPIPPLKARLAKRVEERARIRELIERAHEIDAVGE